MILITGASCAGKTTTATTVLRRLRVPAVFWPRESVRVAVTDRAAPDVADLEHRLFASYVDALVGYARSGFVAIGETIIMNEIDCSVVRDAEFDPPCMIVRLVCSLPVLVKREHVRGTTRPGTAVDTFARELGGAGYDLTIDTEDETPEAAAATVEAAAGRLGLKISSG